jgi:FkbM family methyltransferase
VNVEPVSGLFRRLAVARPRDTTLQLAIGTSSKPVTLYGVVEFDEISTTIPAIGKRYAAEGRHVVETKVPGATLSQVWADNVTGEVHFLKIDVEGAELAVLKGADFTTQRPWIVVVEIVSFGPRNESAAAIDELLVASGYGRVYFDGLNRFYVARERMAELGPAFEVPVNVTDDFVLPIVSTAELALSRVSEALGAPADAAPQEIIERAIAVVADRIAFENQAIEFAPAVAELESARSLAAAAYQLSFERERQLAAVVAQSDDYRNQVNKERRETQSQLQEVYRSSSWRATLPLRALRHPGRYLRRLFHR